MTPILWIAYLVFWAAWAYPYMFRAPHGQKRKSVTARGATLLGLALELAAYSVAFTFYFPMSIPRNDLRLAVFFISGPIAGILAWTSVTHLGRQFRITAGLYEDHKLVTTGPYSIVRHPIYASMLAILICSQSILTPVRWAAVSLILFVAGTEIRVRAEEALLASRFGEAFQRYRKSVSAYIPFVR
jgi:protein-S-isoprenylcysteine O-methyltransferase Ste14